MLGVQRRKQYLKYIHAEMLGSAGKSYISRSTGNKIIYNGVCSSGKFLIWTYKPKAPSICNAF